MGYHCTHVDLPHTLHLSQYKLWHRLSRTLGKHVSHETNRFLVNGCCILSTASSYIFEGALVAFWAEAPIPEILLVKNDK